MSANVHLKNLTAGIFIYVAFLAPAPWAGATEYTAPPSAVSQVEPSGIVRRPLALQIAQGYDGADVKLVWQRLRSVKQRTKTRQISGGDNINVMQFTTRDGSNVSMDGAIIYFKKFKTAFSYFNARFLEFFGNSPTRWEDYGTRQDAAKRFSNNDIKAANQKIVDVFNWFKGKQVMIGNQGGVIFLYGKNGYIAAYQDKNGYKENNVAGILTKRSSVENINISNDVFPMPPGLDEFVRLLLEDQQGNVKIEVPYILYEVP